METLYEETIGDHTIRIVQDDSPENPFEAWDCNPPLAVYSDRDITTYATKYGDVLICPTLTRKQILANMKEVLEICEETSVMSLCRTAKDYSYFLDDGINDYISEMVDGSYSSDRLEHLCTLYNAVGQPAIVKSISGYSQGDWAEVLAVATPEFQKACGSAEGYWDDPDKLRPSIRLFENWAYGNVYGYVITDNRTDEEESCWGFFGDYDGTYGALTEAKNIVARGETTHHDG